MFSYHYRRYIVHIAKQSLLIQLTRTAHDRIAPSLIAVVKSPIAPSVLEISDGVMVLISLELSSGYVLI